MLRSFLLNMDCEAHYVFRRPPTILLPYARSFSSIWDDDSCKCEVQNRRETSRRLIGSVDSLYHPGTRFLLRIARPRILPGCSNGFSCVSEQLPYLFPSPKTAHEAPDDSQTPGRQPHRSRMRQATQSNRKGCHSIPSSTLRSGTAVDACHSIGAKPKKLCRGDGS